MRRFPTIGACVMGGALVAGAATGVARAAIGEPFSDPATTFYVQRGLDAQAKAAAADQRAAELGPALGGQVYKGGQVQRAENAAVIADLKANEDFARAGVPSCQTMPPPQPPPSPELTAAEKKVKALKNDGGWAYKTGSVARAEAEVRAIKQAELQAE